MEKIYNIDPTIYSIQLINKALLDYDDFFKEQNIQARYEDNKLVLNSSSGDDRFFYDFTNYLLSLHVVS